ncbi:MAG: hypothetical protein FWC41_00195 [Firmicutes bacterium]|nr:hypothetical protein [Bacillota bacterium]
MGFDIHVESRKTPEYWNNRSIFKDQTKVGMQDKITRDDGKQIYRYISVTSEFEKYINASDIYYGKKALKRWEKVKYLIKGKEYKKIKKILKEPESEMWASW